MAEKLIKDGVFTNGAYRIAMREVSHNDYTETDYETAAVIHHDCNLVKVEGNYYAIYEEGPQLTFGSYYSIGDLVFSTEDVHVNNRGAVLDPTTMKPITFCLSWRLSFPIKIALAKEIITESWVRRLIT